MYTKALAIFLLFGLSPLANADLDSTDTPVSAAEAWLVLADELDYQESWSEASSLLRAEVSQPEWAENLRNIRAPLGLLEQRNMETVTFHGTLPDAPDGEYVTLRFDSSFESMASAVEIVVVVKEQDSIWRVIGYFFE